MIDGANEGRQLHLDADLCLQQSFSQLVMKNIHSLKFSGIVPPSWNNISGFRANITFLKSNCYAEQTHCPPGLEKENYWKTHTHEIAFSWYICRFWFWFWCPKDSCSCFWPRSPGGFLRLLTWRHISILGRFPYYDCKAMWNMEQGSIFAASDPPLTHIHTLFGSSCFLSC